MSPKRQQTAAQRAAVAAMQDEQIAAVVAVVTKGRTMVKTNVAIDTESDLLVTRVIHVDELDDWMFSVYIGRANGRKGFKGSKWANPYTLKHHTRQDAITLYEQHLVTHPELWAQLPELRGCQLACWCRRSDEARTRHNRCHGDVLADLLNTHTDEQLIAAAEGRLIP